MTDKPASEPAPPSAGAVVRRTAMEAFARACLPHRADLLSSALRLCRRRDDADDLVQDVLVRAMLAHERFRQPAPDPDSDHDPATDPAPDPDPTPNSDADADAEGEWRGLGAWLRRILRNEFISGYRTRIRHARLLEARPVDAREALHSPASRAMDPRAALLAVDPIGPEVSTAICRMRPDHRELVERADLRGESYATISVATGMPMGTVMSRLHRARRSLGDDLREVARRDYGLRARQAPDGSAE